MSGEVLTSGVVLGQLARWKEGDIRTAAGPQARPRSCHRMNASELRMQEVSESLGINKYMG